MASLVVPQADLEADPAGVHFKKFLLKHEAYVWKVLYKLGKRRYYHAICTY